MVARKPEFQTLLFEKRDRIALITLHRPEKLNALNAVCKKELREVFGEIRAGHDVDAAILTGSGEKAFAAGTDISELKALDPESGKEFALSGQALFDQIQHLGKPVLAAVNGYALGGGCELALACHLRIASENAIFGQPEVNLGIIPGYGGTQRLPRLIGAARAAAMILTGNPIDAQEALRIGLVNVVVPRARLLEEAETIARTILSKGQIAVRMSLKAINITMEMPLSEGLKVEASMFGECCGTADFAEGTGAFLGKRKPSFTGR
jgi:enoyl-CoA hydratase